MPWETSPVSELRLALVHAVRSAGLSVADAARRFGVSRKTAFKWLARHDAHPCLCIAHLPPVAPKCLGMPNANPSPLGRGAGVRGCSGGNISHAAVKPRHFAETTDGITQHRVRHPLTPGPSPQRRGE
ncbi:MAG: helix-turn-helix domain-containing protein [Planctomycetaceae bacterium]|nr:helix-turn-helix domain-containing protein [Planctomycetaceae bacterium]